MNPSSVLLSVLSFFVCCIMCCATLAGAEPQIDASEQQLKKHLGLGYHDGVSLRLWITDTIGVEESIKTDTYKERRNPGTVFGKLETDIFAFTSRSTVLWTISKGPRARVNFGLFFGWEYKERFYPVTAHTHVQNTFSLGINPEIEFFLPFLKNVSVNFGPRITYTWANRDVVHVAYHIASNTMIIDTQKVRKLEFEGINFQMLGVRYYF